MTRLAAGLALVLLGPIDARAQQTFDQWFAARVDALVMPAGDAAVGENGKGVERQREAPADDRSTSLVDQSAATDFVAASMNLATTLSPALAQQLGSQPNGAQAVTASLYSLLAGLNGKALTDPGFYGAHVDARRAFFTIGTAASEQEKHNTDKPATVVGLKVLILNGRDLFTKANLARLSMVQSALSTSIAANAGIKDRIQQRIFRFLHPDGFDPRGVPDPATFGTFLATELSPGQVEKTIATLSPEVAAGIDAEIAAAAESATALRAAIEDAYDAIRGARQLAVQYTARTRADSGYDEHRAELVFDYGLSPRITWTANGSFDYVDKKAAGTDKGGRIATEFVGDIGGGREAWGRVPLRVSVAAAIAWSAGTEVQRDLQAKLTIPVGAGVDLPIVYRYTDDRTETNADGVQTRFGLSIDLGRVAKALR